MTIETDLEEIDMELAACELEQARLSAKIVGLRAQRDALARHIATQLVPTRDNNDANLPKLRELTNGGAIVEVLRRSAPVPRRIGEIVTALKAAGRRASYNGVSVDLNALLAQGRVRRVERGLYTVALSSVA